MSRRFTLVAVALPVIAIVLGIVRAECSCGTRTTSSSRSAATIRATCCAGTICSSACGSIRWRARAVRRRRARAVLPVPHPRRGRRRRHRRARHLRDGTRGLRRRAADALRDRGRPATTCPRSMPPTSSAACGRRCSAAPRSPSSRSTRRATAACGSCASTASRPGRRRALSRRADRQVLASGDDQLTVLLPAEILRRERAQRAVWGRGGVVSEVWTRVEVLALL